MRRTEGDPSPHTKKRPNAAVAWWEGISTVTQLVISFPVFALLMFVINAGPFNQPVVRSILYGLFEGGLLAGLLAIATATERGRRV